MCKHGSTLPLTINGRLRDIDSCIRPLVAALNTSNLPTISSCCGHGNRPGVIMLQDGRELIITTGRRQTLTILKDFPDIHGNNIEIPLDPMTFPEKGAV